MAKRSRISKMVLDRTREDQQIRTTLTVHGPRAMADLVDKLTPFLEPDEQLDLPTLPTVLARLIQDREERLTRADMARAERQEARRQQRDRAADELRRLVIQLRRAAEARYGTEPAGVFLVVSGETPRQPLALWRVGRRIVTRLRDPGVKTPEPIAPGGPLAREEWAALLEPTTEELDEALQELRRGRSKDRETLADKRRAIEEHDRDVGGSARLAEALFGLAERPDIAKSVRPTSPRQRRRRRQSQGQRQATSRTSIRTEKRVTGLPGSGS